MKSYLTELIGTFFLVLTVGFCVVGDVALAPIAIGSTLMVMVYMGGHVSGGHYNPAVSLAVFLRGKLAAKDVAPFMIAQLVGAAIATYVVRFCAGSTFVPAPAEGVTNVQALTVEFVFTFALALVVLNVATSAKLEGNSFYGLAIGFTITAAAAAGGPISGGAYNPAVGIGSAIVHTLASGASISHVWLYLAGPLFGGALAAVVFRIQEETA